MSDEAEDLTPGQMALIRLNELPERNDVLTAIKERPAVTAPVKWKHTGARFFEKAAADTSPGGLAETVLTGLRMGMSVRLLAWRLGISPNTLAAARQMFTERGELEAVRLRVDRLIDEVTEESLEYWRDGMRSGVIHPGAIPIPALAAFDKRSQRDAGLVPGTGRALEEINRDRVLAALEVSELASDMVSANTLQKGQQIEVISAPDTASDAVHTAPKPGPAAIEAAAVPTSPAGQEAGGGVAPRGGEHERDASH